MTSAATGTMGGVFSTVARRRARDVVTRGKKSSSTDDVGASGRGKKAKSTKPYPESRLVEVHGEKYRLCAAALVFNDRGEVLCGERSDRPGSWNMPQGGVEAGETTREAATRELFEETGIRAMNDAQDDAGIVRVIGELPKDDGYCYKVEGENWLTKRGLAGQRLEFCLFHWRTVDDPMSHPGVDLGGLNGEPKEFSQLKWMHFDDLVRDVWGTKKAPYALARDASRALIRAALTRDPGR